MDIETRKQLEQLEYIKDKLEYIEYSESLQCYVEKLNGIPTGVAAWVNGAFYGFEQAAKAQAVPDTNISFKYWISDHKNDYVHFGGYQERAHELANRAWNASANNSTPKDKVLMPKKLSTKHIDYVVKELAITGGISLIEEVYQCLIEAQEPAND